MEKETRPFISWQLADDFMTAVFEKMGVPTEDARLCADVLLESDRRGIESHGCNRFKPIYIDRIKSGILNPVTKIDILKETPTTAVLDANDGMGMVASKKAMDMCIEKAHKYGMGMVAVRNSSHYGIAGYWTGLAAKENMIGISGTNALTFSMPTDEPFPFTLDCATSVIQNGKIEYYARINHDTPKGLVISREGEELTDSAEILKKIRSQQAALAPLGGFGETTGGYKGYGYSTVVEILSAALQSGLFLKALDGKDEEGKIRPYHLGHFFIAIDTEAFMGAEAFKKTCGDILRDLRGSEKAPGQERIYTAGEKEYDVWMYRKDKGVPVTEAVQKEFIGLRDEFGLTQFKFPFEK